MFYIGAIGLGVGTFVNDPFINLHLHRPHGHRGNTALCASGGLYPTSFLSRTAQPTAVGLINSSAMSEVYRPVSAGLLSKT